MKPETFSKRLIKDAHNVGLTVEISGPFPWFFTFIQQSADKAIQDCYGMDQAELWLDGYVLGYEAGKEYEPEPPWSCPSCNSLTGLCGCDPDLHV